jgi:hypothetical protein
MAPKVKTVKNSKFPKLLENYFEQVGKGGWPPISTCIIRGMNQSSGWCCASGRPPLPHDTLI